MLKIIIIWGQTETPSFKSRMKESNNVSAVKTDHRTLDKVNDFDRLNMKLLIIIIIIKFSTLFLKVQSTETQYFVSYRLYGISFFLFNLMTPSKLLWLYDSQFNIKKLPFSTFISLVFEVNVVPQVL